MRARLLVLSVKCASCEFESDNASAVYGHAGAKHARPLRPIRHGTTAGYQAELRRGLTPCRACRRAWRMYYQRRNGTGSMAGRRLRKMRALKKDGGRSTLRAIRVAARRRRMGAVVTSGQRLTKYARATMRGEQ